MAVQWYSGFATEPLWLRDNLGTVRCAFRMHDGGCRALLEGLCWNFCALRGANFVKEGHTMTLERELETYRANLATLRENEGRFVLVHGDAIDTFTAYDDALREGYRRYGLEPFLVKRIEATERIHTITRLLERQCPTLR